MADDVTLLYGGTENHHLMENTYCSDQNKVRIWLRRQNVPNYNIYLEADNKEVHVGDFPYLQIGKYSCNGK